MNRFKSEYPRRNTPTGTKVYLNWAGLKENICPKCNKDFMQDNEAITAHKPYDVSDRIFIQKCGFKIRESRYKQIVSSQITSQLQTEAQEEWDLSQ